MTSTELRKGLLQASYEAGACHIGSALSCADILIELFYEKGIKPEQFIFGKASGVGAYYVVLADLGYFPESETASYLKKYPLPSKEVPGMLHSFGSCGHALSVAAGMALGDRDKEYYVLLSDGECQEGSTLESAAFIGHHYLTNLHVFVDNNRLQGIGLTDDVICMRPIFRYMSSVIPDFHLVDTVKGKGVSFMENDNSWHYRNLTSELLEQALKEL